MGWIRSCSNERLTIDSASLVVNPVPEKADSAWNLALFLSNPVIIKAIDAALTKRKEISMASKVGKRKYNPLIFSPIEISPSKLKSTIKSHLFYINIILDFSPQIDSKCNHNE